MNVYIGHFKCQDPRKGMGNVGCKKEWHAQVGPTSCSCGNNYITWLNYPEQNPMQCSMCNLKVKTK